MLDVKRLQARLGVRDDGDLGSDTMRALFARCGASASIASELGLSAAVHFRRIGMTDSGLRLAHGMAQFGHESGAFRYMEEIWGPTDAQRKYEGRVDLGNTTKGDGFRYKGRGPIQITGRANYSRYGRAIGIDLEQRPDLAAIPSIGLIASCEYWLAKGLNRLADADDLEAITRRINGGTNGLADRRERLRAAKALLL